MGDMEKTPGGSIEERILQRLTDAEDRENIILDLCETENLNWSEARAMVDAVEARKKNQIVLAQSPVLVMIALGIFIGGLVLLGYAVYNIAVVYETYTSTLSPASVGFLLVSAHLRRLLLGICHSRVCHGCGKSDGHAGRLEGGV